MMGNDQENTTLKGKPSIEQWKKLYALADKFKKLEPWNQLRDSDLLIIDLPDEKEPVVCSIMGNGDMTFGLSVYPGYEAFFRLSQLLHAENKMDDLMWCMEQRCISCQFVDREEIEHEDRHIIKKLGLRFRGKNQWTNFRSVRPGQLPWFLDTDEAAILLKAMEQLLSACQSFMSGETPVDFDQHMLRWSYSEEDGRWQATAVPSNDFVIPIAGSSLALSNEIAMAQLKKKKKTKAVLELLSIYLPVPHGFSETGAPQALHLLLLVDRKKKELVDREIIDDEPSWEICFASMLLDYVQEHGRPTALHVRTMLDAFLLNHLCEELGIRLHSGDRMELSSDFVMDLMARLAFECGLDDDDDYDDDDDDDYDDDDDFF